MIKKIALLLAIVMTLTVLPNVSLAASSSEEAYIIFGEDTVQSNMKASVNSNEYIRKDSESAIVLNPEAGATAMNISMSGSYSKLTDGSCVEVTVRYFDEGQGKFSLFYDGENGKVSHPEVIRMKNTCIWKDAVFILQNPKFAKGVGGCDIQISLSNEAIQESDGKVFISQIRAKKMDYKSVYDVDLSTENVGNIFFSDEEIAIDASVGLKPKIKVSDTLCDILYEVKDADGAVVWSKTEEDIDLTESYITKIKPQNLKFGLYDLYVTVKNDDNNYKSIYPIYFSYAKAARKNPDFGAATHYNFGFPEPEKALHLFEKGGIGFNRDGIHWDSYEISQGLYSLDKEQPITKMYELQKKSPVDLLNLLAYGNTMYQDLPNGVYMPTTDAATNAFGDFAKNLSQEVSPEYLEVWNEPNVPGFNPGNASWEAYVKILKSTYKKVKSQNENIKIVGGSLVSIPVVPLDNVKEILDYGGGEYMDALAIHPYIWDTSPMHDDLPGKIRVLEEFLTQSGYPDMKIWITEMGWGAGPVQDYTYEQQAAYLVQSYLICKSFKSFEKFVWYDFQCDGINEEDREKNFGIINNWADLNRPWGARKAYIATTFMNDLMSGAEFVDNSKDTKNGYMYHYKNDGKDIYAVFSTDSTYYTGLSSNKSEVSVFDMYGNESIISTKDGVLNILGGEEVVYIVGENLALEFAEPTISISDKNIGIVYGEEAVLEVSLGDGESAEYKAVTEFVDVIGTDDGRKGIISFNEITSDMQKIEVSVRAGEKLYLQGCVTAECVPTVTASISNSLYSLKNFNRWVGSLEITNNSKKTPISGTLVFSAPDFFAKKLPPLKIPDIAPGKTMVVEFPFPEILRKEAYDVNAKINLSNGDLVQIADRIDFAIAAYTSKKPVIDGVIESNEWVMGSALAFNREEQAYSLDGFSWNGKEDLSGRVCIEYDEDNFYMAAVVTDDVFFQEKTDDSIWQGDSVQFGVGYQRANNNKNTTSFTEVGMALTPQGEVVVTYSVEDPSLKVGMFDLEREGVECKIKRNGNQTVYELKIPWMSIVSRGAEFTGGKNLAFSMLVNDNDGQGRKGWVEYASGIGLGKNINLFTFLKLMDK